MKEQNLTGRVKTYNATKRFGFLVTDSFPQDIFVYQTHLVGRIALQQGEEVIFDLVTDNGRPQGRNVRATAPAPEGAADVAGDTAQQLFPKGTVVQVAGHPLDEWNGKQGTIQFYDRGQKHFVVDFGKMKLNLKAEFLRFHAPAPEAPGPAAAAPEPDKKAEKAGDITELGAELVGYTLHVCESGEHDQLAAQSNEAVSITHQAGEWMYAYVIAEPSRVGWLHRDNFSRQAKGTPVKVPPPPAPVATPAAEEGGIGTPSNDTSEWEAVESPAVESPAVDKESEDQESAEKPAELKGKEALDWLWSGRDKKP